MAKLSVTKTDAKKTQDGVWRDYACGIKLLIASVSNPKYTAMVEDLLKPHMRRIQNGLMPTQERLDIIKPAVAKHILLDWKNVEDEAGNPQAYSYEAAMLYFSDPTMVDFYNFVIECATDIAMYRCDAVEAAKENL